MHDNEPWTYLNGVEYPATKLELIAIAESNGAPEHTLEKLQALQAEQFRSAQALHASLGKV